MKIKILLFLLFVTLTVYSGLSAINSEYIHYGFSPIADYYSENLLGVESAGRGYTGVACEGGIASTFINPASLSMDKKF